MNRIDNTKLEQEIFRLFEEGIKKRKIGRMLNVSTSYIDRIILERSKPKRTLVAADGFRIVARCKNTGKIFDDYENKSGVITTYVKENQPDFKIPTPFKRRKIFKENNRYWYEDFFEIIQLGINQNDPKKCKYCEWETNDVENKSGWYTTHLLKVHGKTIDMYVEDFPEEKVIFKTHFSKKDKREMVLSSPKNHISCRICGEKMSKVTNSHLKNKHGMTLLEYKTDHSVTLSETSLEKFRRLYDENLKELSGKFVSKPQAEISDFISGLGFQVELNDKSVLSGTEIDILIREKMLAIEFDGLYYHSELSGKKTRLYHRDKTRFAESRGLRLIHVFEDEWKNRPEIVKNKLRHILGKESHSIIHARKTYISQITKQEKEAFLERNHIQGNDDSALCYGAFFEEKLYAVMTFDDKRSMSKEQSHSHGTFELKRFATENGFLISGIASKILKRFVADFSPKRVISFADLRWTASDSNLYLKMGFVLEREIPPDYSYTYCNSGAAYRLHKFGFGKKSISRKFPETFSHEKTEWEMMQEKGFDRIWDCGKLKYVLEP